MTETQRAVLAVPHPGQSQMTWGLLVDLLEQKIMALVQKDPQAAHRALEMSEEWAPEMYLIAQDGSPQTWNRQIVMSDGMMVLLGLIDSNLENRKSGPPPAMPDPVGLMEIVATLK